AASERRFSGNKWPALACVAALIAQAAWFAAQGASRFQLAEPSPAGILPGGEALGNSERVSRVLFSQYLLPFELASILLLVAIIGAVVMAKKRI
ncbi:MAG: NADH-quinone oxidoreductase subunit J family protein, partial [Burkholderiales bacterium]